jgi:phosphohistidine phosphatase
MDVYLVRHGRAVSENFDPRRPLTAAGRDTVEQVAHAAAARGVQVNQIVHSGILRAEQTAAILAEILQPIKGIRHGSGLRPEDDPVWAKADIESAAQPIMLVGHLPHLGRLAGCLAYGDPDRSPIDFEPATIASFLREDRVWKLNWVLAKRSE